MTATDTAPSNSRTTTGAVDSTKSTTICRSTRRIPRRREARTPAGLAAAPRTRLARAARGRRRRRERRAALGSAAGRSAASTTASRRSSTAAARDAAGDRRGAVRCGAGAGDQPDVRSCAGPGGSARRCCLSCAGGFPPLPAPRRRLPRPLHLRAGGRALDQRRRRHPGDAGDRLRRPDHRGADPGRHRGAARRARRASSA